MTFTNYTSNNASVLLRYFPEESKFVNFAKEVRSFIFSYGYPVIFGIGSFWNLLIIVYLIKINYKNLKRMSSYHFLIVNLNVADLCASLGISINYPFHQKPSWELGAFGCIFRSHLSNGFMLVISTYLIRTISIDCISITCKNQQKEIWFGLSIALDFCFSFKFLFFHGPESKEIWRSFTMLLWRSAKVHLDTSIHKLSFAHFLSLCINVNFIPQNENEIDHRRSSKFVCNERSKPPKKSEGIENYKRASFNFYRDRDTGTSLQFFHCDIDNKCKKQQHTFLYYFSGLYGTMASVDDAHILHEQRPKYFHLRQNNTWFSKIFVDNFYIRNLSKKKSDQLNYLTWATRWIISFTQE